MNNAIKVGMAFAGAAAIAVGGTAFTASQTVPDNTIAGYGTADVVSPVATTSIVHTLSADGTKIASSALTFGEGLSATSVVKAQFGTADLVTCNPTVGGVYTAYTCLYTGVEPTTSTAALFNVAVTGPSFEDE